MKYLAHGVLSAFVVVWTTSGCGTVERQSAPPASGISSHEAGLAAAGPSVDPATEVQSTGNRFNRNALSLNVYGLSYHPDRKTVHRLDLDNEVNPGLGLHYDLDDDGRGITFVEVGAYYDSGKNWTKFASLGYQFKMGGRWRLGGALAVFNSRTYNDGAAFISMIPLVTYDFGRFRLNMVYFPKFGHYNEIAAFGFYLGIPFKQ